MVPVPKKQCGAVGVADRFRELTLTSVVYKLFVTF